MFEVFVHPADYEVWMCLYSQELRDFYWHPFPSVLDPSDAVVYDEEKATDATGVTYDIMPRLEWIGHNLYAGTDFFMRNSSGVRVSAPAGTVAHRTMLFSYNTNTSSWTLCRDSGFLANGIAGPGLIGTHAYGNAPCGTRWYTTFGYVERKINGAWQLVTPAPVTTFGGSTMSGTTPEGSPSAISGMIWDPKPGDATKQPKPPKMSKNQLKQFKAPAPAVPIGIDDVVAG